MLNDKINDKKMSLENVSKYLKVKMR